MTEKRKAKYLVAYRYGDFAVWGKGDTYTEAVTLREARSILKEMPCEGAVIYKLVPVEASNECT